MNILKLFSEASHKNSEDDNTKPHFSKQQRQAFFENLKAIHDQGSKNNSTKNFCATAIALAIPLIGWSLLAWNKYTRGSTGLFFTEGGSKQLAKLALHEIESSTPKQK